MFDNSKQPINTTRLAETVVARRGILTAAATLAAAIVAPAHSADHTRANATKDMPPKTTPYNFIANFKANPGRENDLKRILSKMVAPTRSESGCVNYDLHQYVDDPSRFVLYEGWISADALAVHMEMPYFKQMLKDLEGVVAERDDKGRPFRAVAVKMISERA